MTEAKVEHHHLARFLRYLAIGAINTAFGFGVYSGLIYAGAPIWLALLLANVAGVSFNFMTTGTFVFRASLRNRLLRFLYAYVCIYFVNMALLALIEHLIHGAIMAQAILTLPMAAFAYMLLNHFVFPADVRR